MLYSYNMSSQANQDQIFRALASGTRRLLLDALKAGPLTTGALCEALTPLDRCTVMQHLKVLETADLVMVERRGRERWNHLNPLPIKAVHDRWIGDYARRAVGFLAEVKDELET